MVRINFFTWFKLKICFSIFFLNDINHFFRRWHFINKIFLKTPLLDFYLYCFEILDNHLACLIISNVTKNSVFCLSNCCTIECYHDIVFTNIRGILGKTHLVIVYYLFEINIIWYVYSWNIFHIYYSITNTGLKRFNWWLYIHYLICLFIQDISDISFYYNYRY